ncbi:CotO family spore coat protein [Halobacillus amylolyticus]|uniref:Spore coat CotO family protein n=1 Tax=Halobacillus amylolyticus TaxID=2932259 RepID=A0ABY4HGZ2_9BACI|nr:CotO family spore coat protein [Halobacillus amylolyticus]UOR13110.1 spore coat CotO family protein [Halobacillus amylolyticus]
MANRRKNAKPPVLYITQPHLDPVEISMQTSYHSETKENQSKSQPESESKGEPRSEPKSESTSQRYSSFEKQLRQRVPQSQNTKKKSQSKQEVEAVKSKADQTEESKKAESNRDRRQKFRDMTIEEKVNYFISLPAQVPKMKCEVSTPGEGQIRGYIQRYEEGMVYMKTFQKPFQKEVALEDIQSIRLLGF